MKIIFVLLVIVKELKSQDIENKTDCNLTKIREQDGLVEDKIGGVWYEVRWYPEPEASLESELWDLSATIDEDDSKEDTLIWTLNAREKGELEHKCKDTWKAERKSICPGYYDFTDSVLGKPGEAWIVYTDYDNFLVEFECFEKQGDVCSRPEVGFWSRTQKPRKEDLKKGQDLIKDLCVKPKAFLDKLHDVDCVTSEGGVN